jgi:hypothetical protein
MPEQPTSRRRGRVTMTLVGAALLALAIAGCGSSSSSDAGASPSGTVSSGSTGGQASGDSTPGGGASTYHQPVGAIKDLSGVHCTASPDGAWSMSGTLSNQTSKERTYDVLAAVIKPATSEVLGSKKVTVKVDAGQKAPVKAPSFYRGKTKGVQCTQVVTLHE